MIYHNFRKAYYYIGPTFTELYMSIAVIKYYIVAKPPPFYSSDSVNSCYFSKPFRAHLCKNTCNMLWYIRNTDQDKCWSDEAPTQLPPETWSEPDHQLYVLVEPLGSCRIIHSNS
jgi:hypothetical protein